MKKNTGKTFEQSLADAFAACGNDIEPNEINMALFGEFIKTDEKDESNRNSKDGSETRRK